MPLLLESFWYNSTSEHVDCQVSLNGLKGNQPCSGLEVVAALATLKAACCAELSGPASVGEAFATVVELPSPIEITVAVASADTVA